mmetsp:Transcript_55928/g.98051  ORF Transcript_55928/g.98051 Transcript_55928/m.98051 type:complete len:236 (-) Transcript_55928:2122-2829(-)
MEEQIHITAVFLPATFGFQPTSVFRQYASGRGSTRLGAKLQIKPTRPRRGFEVYRHTLGLGLAGCSPRTIACYTLFVFFFLFFLIFFQHWHNRSGVVVAPRHFDTSDLDCCFRGGFFRSGTFRRQFQLRHGSLHGRLAGLVHDRRRQEESPNWRQLSEHSQRTRRIKDTRFNITHHRFVLSLSLCVSIIAPQKQALPEPTKADPTNHLVEGVLQPHVNLIELLVRKLVQHGVVKR